MNTLSPLKLVILLSLWLFTLKGLAETLYIAGGSGIHAVTLDGKSGKLGAVKQVAELKSPSFLAIHPEKPFLYATNNDGDQAQRTSSHFHSFLITEDELIELSSVETGGSTSAFVELDQRGRFAYVANYRWGTVAGFQLEPDGRIGVPTVLVQHEGSGPLLPRQEEPHPHAVRISPDNRFAYVPDLGTDEVFIYRINHFDGSLSSAIEGWSKVGEGAGPRHLDFHPQRDMVYLINELNSTISVLKRNSDLGALVANQTLSTLPSGYSGPNSGAHIQAHPNGKWIYGSNRGHDSIAIYETTKEGYLTLVGHQGTGKTPRHFAIDPSGKWMVVGNQGDGTVSVFEIDPATGTLAEVSQNISVPSPVCLVFAP